MECFMPANYSSKRIADAERFSRWAAAPDTAFSALGITRDQLCRIQSKMSGHVIFKGDPGYEEARRIFNPIFNEHPGVILYCQTEQDVAFALELGALVPDGLTLRSGGHSTNGYSTGNGVLIDLTGLDHIHIDPVGKQAVVGTGVTFGKFYSALETYGLTVPGGECPDVRIGGYAQGGGYGFTSVTYGMNCDNAVAFRVMLADRSIVTADATTNPDLYWALRGGTGGNFGVVLSVTYRLFDIGPVTGFALLWKLTSPAGIDQAAAALMALQKGYMRNSKAGPQMNLQVSLCFQNWFEPSKKPPPNATLEPCFMVRGMWLGDPGKLDALLQPLEAMPGCIRQWVKQASFREMNEELLNFPQGMPVLDQMPFEDKSCRYIARDLTRSEWASLLTLFADAPHNMAYGYGEFYGGAINAVAPLETAFVHRDVAMNMVMDVFWLLDADRPKCEAFLSSWTAALEPLSNGMIYQNYPNPSDGDYADRFWGRAYPGLQMVKAKYDPENLFAFPQQVYATPFEAGALDPAMPAPVVAALQREVEVLRPAPGG
jgi:hypothetical protein